MVTTPNGIALNQRNYLHDLLVKIGMDNAKACSTPMATFPTLTKNSGSLLPNGEQYRHVVGALQYATITRPDIAFTVNRLCQFMHSPTDEH